MTATAHPPASPPDTAVPVRPGRRRWSWTVLALIALAVAGFFGGQYAEGLAAVAARTPDNVSAASHFGTLPAPIRILFLIHVGTAAVALGIGALQFSSALRRRSPRAHRVVGRVYLLAVGAAALTGLPTSLWNSLGIRGVVGYALLDVAWGLTAWLAYRAARRRRFREHQAWAIRTFALSYAAVTLRAGLPVLIALQLPFDPGGLVPRAVRQRHAHDRALAGVADQPRRRRMDHRPARAPRRPLVHLPAG
ncbi:DUF2306 domain-containing protein [Pseudonocardia sp. ICBG1293]|uniref:DUF2306 domain-containing protein n=1 Tax=Pseudonocardia sp. ICBG1293 TaxID=2844382 RepID=UPI001CC9DC2A|nr:DUF2306 domain-containing protein [Pseudonocardia sp. ICBG1293]